MFITERFAILSDMCRSIKRLNAIDHHATDEEITAAALQFVRKVSGMRHPSRVNEKAFMLAVGKVSKDIHVLLQDLSSLRVNHE